MKKNYLYNLVFKFKMTTQKEKNIELTSQQQKAYNLMAAGKNIFITGPSGTGKSLIISKFRENFSGIKNIAITSTTGISSILIGGTTLHSYLGIGLGTGTPEELKEKIEKNRKVKKRWLELDILVIDEISMLSPELFDKLEKLARLLRCNNFSRLLDSNTGENQSIDLSTKQPVFGGIQLVLSGDFLQLPVVGISKFCFESDCWGKTIESIIYLDEIVRQSDNEFQQVLNAVRYGEVTENVKKVLNKRIGVQLKNDLGIKPTRIFTTNWSVDKMNEIELDRLSENNEFYEYNMTIVFYEFIKNRNEAIEKLQKNCLAPSCLQLCKGAQVMLLVNLSIEKNLVNGSRGVVIGFIDDKPLVRFLNGVEEVIDYYHWEIEEDKKEQAKISQLPLKLAWAITVHKSQGCTLDYAEIDLKNVFEYGQAYVALSRVKTQEGLNILSIDYDSIRAHPRAVEFYKKFLK